MRKPFIALAATRTALADTAHEATRAGGATMDSAAAIDYAAAVA